MNYSHCVDVYIAVHHALIRLCGNVHCSDVGIFIGLKATNPLSCQKQAPALYSHTALLLYFVPQSAQNVLLRWTLKTWIIFHVHLQLTRKWVLLEKNPFLLFCAGKSCFPWNSENTKLWKDKRAPELQLRRTHADVGHECSNKSTVCSTGVQVNPTEASITHSSWHMLWVKTTL